jgi:inorganic pyrophosphatase
VITNKQLETISISDDKKARPRISRIQQESTGTRAAKPAANREAEPATDYPNQTFLFKVEAPSGLCNVYKYDVARQALQLESVVHANPNLPADCGALVGTLGSDGRPLAAYLVVRQSLPAGCLADTRVIGGITSPENEVQVIAVPQADPYFKRLVSYQDIPDDQRRAIEQFVTEMAFPAGSPATTRWLDAIETNTLVRQAQRAARMASAANRKVDGRSAWQITDPVFRKLRRTGETQTHSEAEISVWDLPYRWQNHVADCLLPEERILHSVHRLPFSVASRFSFLRSRRINEGLLLITDRQVLVMSDAIAQDEALIDWGYTVTAVPVERLKDVWLGDSGGIVTLGLEIEANGGSQRISMEFATASSDACRYGEHVLRHFIPTSSSYALRRLYEVKPSSIDLADAKGIAKELVGLSAIERLETASAQALISEKQELARILVPTTMGGGRGPAQMLLLTQDKIILIEDHRGGAIVKGSAAVRDVATIELRNSILGSHIRMALPMEDQVEWLSTESPNPSVFKPMVQFFRAMVPVLANPSPRPDFSNQEPSAGPAEASSNSKVGRYAR